MKKNIIAIIVLAFMCSVSAQASTPANGVTDGSILPFPEPPSASKAGKTLADSKHQW